MVLRLGLTKKMAIGASLAVMVMVNWMGPGLAGDPFRKNNPRPIGDKTEAAFNAIFKQGNYLEAKKLIVEATEKEPQEPLSHAMRASLAFTDQDWNTLKTYSEKTRGNLRFSNRRSSIGYPQITTGVSVFGNRRKG